MVNKIKFLLSYKLFKSVLLTFMLLYPFIASTIEYSVPMIPYGVASADIDLDGDMDVIVGSRNNAAQDTISIFVNNGLGNFHKNYLEREIAHYIYCTKINNDDLPDIVTKILEDYQIVYYENEGNGNFGNAIPIHSTLSNHLEFIKIFDMDNDGDNDIVFYKEGSTNSYWGLIKNNGDGEFSENLYYTTDTVITNIAVGFINADDLADVIITTSQYGVKIFYNNLTNFTQVEFDTDYYTYPYLMDIDNDGDNDIGLFTHNFTPGSVCSLKMFYNDGTGTFTRPDTLFFPEGALIKDINDYNNDDYPDITYWCYPWAGPDYSIYVCLNSMNGTFSEPTAYYLGNPPNLRITSSDLDNNNYQDLIATGYAGNDDYYKVKMLFNDGTGNFVEEPQDGINNEELQITNCELNNHPNPFNPSTTISFTLQKRQRISLCLYNLKGQKVKTIFKGTADKGKSSFTLKADELASGMYLYKLKTEKKEVYRKCILLK